MEDSLITIYSSTDVGRAEVIKVALENEGIHCMIDNEHQAGYTGVLGVRILVKAEDAERASRFVAEHEPHE